MNDEKNTSVAASSPQPPRKIYKRKLRNILIHKPMQREFSFVLIALLMISTMAVAFVIHTTVHDMAMGGGYRFGKVSAFEILSDLSYELVIRVSAILFVTLVIIGLYGVFFLHRVAGPVYRFRQTFLRLNDGEIPHSIKLREGDFFGETASEINRMIRRLQFEKQKIKTLLELLAPFLQSAPDEKSAKLARDIQTLMQSDVKEGHGKDPEPLKPR